MSRSFRFLVFLLLAWGTVGLLSPAALADLPADPLVILDCDNPPTGFACAAVTGGSASYSIIASPSTLNPVTTEDTASSSIHDHIFGTFFSDYALLGAGAQGDAPQAASVIEINDERTSVTYTLREGLQYSDGSPVTVEDVLYWYYNVVWNPNLPNSDQDGFTCADGSHYVVTSPGPDQIQVSCPETFRTFTGVAASMRVMSKQMALDLIEAQGIATQDVISAGPNGVLDTEPAGDDEVLGPTIAVGENGALDTAPAGDDVVIQVATEEFLGLSAPLELLRGLGPYVLTSFDSQALAKYERNPNFYESDSTGTQLPYLDELQVIIIPTAGLNLALSNFLNGTTDWYGPRPQDIAVILSQAAAGGFEVNQGIDTGTPVQSTAFASLNFADTNPNLAAASRTREVRKALSLAVDRAALVNNVLLGIGTPQYTPVAIPNSTFFIGRDNTCDDFINAGLASADTCQDGTWFLDNGLEIQVNFLPDPADPNFRQSLSCLNDYAGCLETAKQLLASVGITDTDGDGVLDIPAGLDPVIDNPGGPFEMQVVTNTGNTIREEFTKIICDGWNQIGVKCNAATTSFPTLVQQLLGGEWTGSIVIGLTGGDPAGAINVLRCGAPLMLAHVACDPSAPASDPNAPIEGILAVQDGFLQGFSATTVEDAQAGFDAEQTAWGEHELWIQLAVSNGLFAERTDRVSNTGGAVNGNDDVKFRCDLPGQVPSCADAPHAP